MPELTTLDMTWNDVRKDDHVALAVDGDEMDYVVANIVKKTTWAFADMKLVDEPSNDDNINIKLRKRLSDAVTVGRMTPTADEIEVSRQRMIRYREEWRK